MEDPPTRALTRTTAGLLQILVFLRFLLSVTYLSERIKHDAPLNGLTDGRDIAEIVRL